MRKYFALSSFVFAVPLFAGDPLSVQAALGIREIGNRSPISISSDGVLVAYTVENPERHESSNDPLYRSFTQTGAYREAQGCDVWITDLKSGESTNLTKSQGSSWGPVWSPDGKSLAFYSDRSGKARLWLWDRAARTMKDLSSAVPHPYFNFAVPGWTPDSRKVLIKVLPLGVTVEQAARATFDPPKASDAAQNYPGSTVTVYRAGPSAETPKTSAPVAPAIEDKAYINQYLADLVLIGVTTEQIDRVAKGVRCVGYWVSPDGSYVAYANVRGVQSNTQQTIYSLEVVSAAGGAAKVLEPELKQSYGIAVRWSPDSHSLAYTTDGQTAKGDCWVVSIGGGSPRNLTPGSHPSFGNAYLPPRWNHSGDTLYAIGGGKVYKVPAAGGPVSPIDFPPGHVAMEIVAPAAASAVWALDNMTAMLVMARNTATYATSFLKVDRDGSSTVLFEAPMFARGAFDLDVTRDGLLAYISQDALHADDIWITRDLFKKRERVSRLNPQIEKIEFGASQLIDWTSIDGQPLRGALLLPAGYESGKRYPLIVNVYGGSNLSDGVNRFGLRGSTVDNMQVLATRGYAVLTPDAPLRVASPMRDLLKTVLPGVDRVIQLGIADPDRLGVMGHSYGGYSTLSLIVQTTRFRAAVESAGPANLISLYGQMDPSGSSFAVGWAETGQGRMEGSPWQYRERYIENSPLFYLDRVRTPLLVIQGGIDHAIPSEQADEVFIALQRLGREVEYAKYAGEEHWEGTWSAENVTDYWNRVLRWFDGHLIGVPSNEKK